jgi:O-antigen ligase
LIDFYRAGSDIFILFALLNKETLIKFLDIAILFFLGLHVISSQWYIALSSIGLGGLIITSTARILIGRVYSPDKILVILFSILAFFHLLSSAFSINPAESFILSKRILLYLTFFCTIIFIRDVKDLKYLLYILLIFTFILNVYETIRYIEYRNSLSEMPLSEVRLQEFGYPVTNGEIKMLLLIIVTSLILMKDSLIPKFVSIIVSLPLLLTLYFTNARSAFLGAFTGLLTIGILKNKYFGVILSAAVILFLIFAPAAYTERILSITDPEHPSNTSRIVMWQTGSKIIADHPLTGLGDTDIRQVYEKYKKIEFHGEASHMHNNILQIAVNMGIPGLISWFILMVYILYRHIKIYKNTKNKEELNILTVISIASFVAFQVSGLTEYNFGDFEFSAVLWFCLALGFLAEKVNHTTAK